MFQPEAPFFPSRWLSDFSNTVLFYGFPALDSYSSVKHAQRSLRTKISTRSINKELWSLETIQEDACSSEGYSNDPPDKRFPEKKMFASIFCHLSMGGGVGWEGWFSSLRLADEDDVISHRTPKWKMMFCQLVPEDDVTQTCTRTWCYVNLILRWRGEKKWTRAASKKISHSRATCKAASSCAGPASSLAFVL